MKEKIINARLKEFPQVAVKLDVDFDKDWIMASAVVERAKRELLIKLKNDLHEKVAILSLDDIEFKIIN